MDHYDSMIATVSSEVRKTRDNVKSYIEEMGQWRHSMEDLFHLLEAQEQAPTQAPTQAVVDPKLVEQPNSRMRC